MMRLKARPLAPFPVVLVALAAALLSGLGCDEAEEKQAVTDVIDTRQADADAVDVATPEDLAPEAAAIEVVDVPAKDLSVEPQPPAPKTYSGGVCPQLKEGKNTFMSDGRTRSFELFLPDDPVGAPLLYVYQGQGGSPYDIAYYFGSDAATKDRGAIVVAPYPCLAKDDDCYDMLFVWNYGSYSNSQADLTAFDDILACLDEQFDVDNSRVYTAGFSAGSLWNSFLTIHRGEYFAAVAIFSGGLGTVVAYEAPPAYPMPALLAWGGDNDIYANGVVSFEKEMLHMSQLFQDNGHFVIECDHGLGHSVPWGAGEWAQQFLFAYTWGSDYNPFLKSGALANFPDYCLIP